MGTILTSYGDAGYDHEGYAAQVLDDGTLTGTYGPDTRPRMVGQLVAACDCGWAGTTRYPCADGDPLDEHAEALALQEWEHTHARPILERDQVSKRDRLRILLWSLGTEQHAMLTDRSFAGLGAADRVELLDRILRVLEEAGELARELREHCAIGIAGDTAAGEPS